MDLAFAPRPAPSAPNSIIANDPDADRLAVAIPDRGRAGWRRLSGNEVGLAARLAGGRRAADAPATPANGTLACSSSPRPALGGSPAAYGLDFVDTLTGLQVDLARAGASSSATRRRSATSSNPDTVRDKDGISAAVAFLALAAELKASGRTRRRAPRRLRRAVRCLRLGARSRSGSPTSRASAQIMARLRDEAAGIDRRHPRSSASRTSPTASASFPPATSCASGSRAALASSCARAAPSRSSRSTSTPSSTEGTVGRASRPRHRAVAAARRGHARARRPAVTARRSSIGRLRRRAAPKRARPRASSLISSTSK